MSNRNLLTLVVVLLIGIFAVLIINMNERTPAEKIGDSVSETIDDIGDEIEDQTDNR